MESPITCIKKGKSEAEICACGLEMSYIDLRMSRVFNIYSQSLFQVVQKTAATFAPRASTATKNPAVPGSVLYRVFEVQGYASLLLGGALSFNLIFPSNEPDIWRLMGMWSIWMFSKRILIKLFQES